MGLQCYQVHFVGLSANQEKTKSSPRSYGPGPMAGPPRNSELGPYTIGATGSFSQPTVAIYNMATVVRLHGASDDRGGKQRR